MTTTFTGIDAWHGSIVGPAPSETVTAASVVDGDTLLADRTVYLYTRLSESHRLYSYGETVLSGTASILDLKAITTLAPIPLLESAALPALEASDLLLAEVAFAVVHEGAQEIRFGIDHDAAPLTVAAEYRHAINLPAAVIHVAAHAHFEIAAAVAAGSKLRAVARCAAGGNLTSTIHRAASLRWRLFRKALP